ncbi:PHB depolymerase family esterase [Chitinimonas sp.]|uniref:alpha/beta hydrolase family esterase n=1 Tax=Chitinimonas sp. TaxID=1934313 RepID=UPI0035AE88A3
MTFAAKLKAVLYGIDAPEGPLAAITEGELSRQDGLRRYLLALPSQPPSAKRPLLIMLHGGGASAAQVMGQAFPPSPLSVWREIAEREQWVVVAPEGAGGKGWNDGFADTRLKPAHDDVGFVSDLIDLCLARHQVDADRVYVIGVSRGGMLAYRLAAELGERLAAFAAVLASMPVHAEYAAPSRPLPALIVASSADPFIPYGGGKRWYIPVGAMLGAEASAARWRELAGLVGEPQREVIGEASGKTRATRFSWGKHANQPQLVLIKVEGAGHTEPSRRKRYPAWMRCLIGAQNADFELAEEAWAFFHDKRRGCAD